MVLGGHGLFTWGETQRESYLNTITIIDQLGQFIERHAGQAGYTKFGGAVAKPREDRKALAVSLMPHVRGLVSRKQALDRLVLGHAAGCWTLSTRPTRRTLRTWGRAARTTSSARRSGRCSSRGILRPTRRELPALLETALETYRAEYASYYKKHALADSPAVRDASPTVVLIPGVGMFSFGKNKAESRITGEFYINAIGVMQGAGALGGGVACMEIPQAGPAAGPSEFAMHENYVALPPSEAFRIEYWKLEEAKIQRQPKEKELSRRVVLVVGGGSGIGREVALLAAERGAHVVVADRDVAGAEAVAAEVKAAAGKESAVWTAIDITKRETIQSALGATLEAFGGLDILINTAAIFPATPDGVINDALWATTLEINVTANYKLTDEAEKIFSAQGIDGSIVLTSSANAVVAKKGSEAYDVSKAALSHLVRELAVTYSPKIRVNGISPATVVKGSTMFPRDRVIASLKKYNLPFEESMTHDELRNELAKFYAKRTLTHQPIDPKDCAQAILFVGGPLAPCTTGHIIPVDGGLVEAFLR